MTLRTPRRRISPRTKHRYRIVREFFRRALGSSSQQDIKINSSIAINVTDLKHKIVGLENQLDAVSKHCRDLAFLESISRKESQCEFVTEHHRDIDTIKERTEESDVKTNDRETKLLYKTSESHYIKSDESEYAPNPPKNNVNITKTNIMNPEHYDQHLSKVCKKRLKKNRVRDLEDRAFKNKTKSACDNFDSAYCTTSFHSLVDPRVAKFNEAGYSDRLRETKHIRREHIDPSLFNHLKHKKRKEKNNMDYSVRSFEDNHDKSRRNKHTRRDLDQDFITDIIRRQYKPVKMFGRKESGMSQLSAPVCRDQEFSIHENIQEGELCSCCYDDNSNRMRYRDINDMRSVCDTRLYSTKRRSHSRHRNKHFDMYNDSDQYDLVPVKEKSSPKSRRKFAEDCLGPHNYYREVPPSPRTLRPRLNLKSQHHAEIDNYTPRVKRLSRKDKLKKRQQYTETMESDHSTELSQTYNGRCRKLQKQRDYSNKLDQQHDTATMVSAQFPNLAKDQTNLMVDTKNKTDTDLPVDRTDKALCEIKEMLQSFLLEIKKDSTASQCDKSDTQTNDKLKTVLLNNTQKSSCAIHNSRENFNNYSLPHCSLPPYMPGFNNSCCYPIMPVCPMNCVQNGYIVPSPSFTCASCANNNYEESPKDNIPQPKKEKVTQHSETDKLIKEIYKFIAQSPNVARKKEPYNENSSRRENLNTEDQNILTPRSTGGSSKMSKHDAKVGTPNVKCYSKSCEAIAHRLVSEAYSGTNASYSDTVLEKLSLEPTTTQLTTEYGSSKSTEVDKNKSNKIGKVLRSFGLFKKKKKDAIEELSESESTVEVEVKRRKPPFRQEITNYMMHGQEYFHPPPISPYNHSYQHPPYEHLHRQDYHPAYSPRVPDYPIAPQLAHENMYHSQRMHQQTIHEHDTPHHHHSRPHPSAPPFPNYENYNGPPQVPLCLKEIEVKSAGTQSERKLSLFGKIKKKMQPPGQITARSEEFPQRNCSTQTAKTNQLTNKPGLFNWKNLQAKVGNLDDNTDPLKFSYKTQKRLAEGDIKMRNAMLKKMFYKKNPFSPRNLIVRTLLGKDKSSFGDPPAQFRPRMFF